MKKSFSPAFFLLALALFTVSIKSFPTKIVSGELFVGGSAYQTPNFQNYLAFYLHGKTRMPQRDYEIYGEQTFSVFQNHPIRPNGFYKFSVQMPYHANALKINGQTYQPVWYVNSFWEFESNLITPNGTADSPQFVNVQAPFRMGGIVVCGGAFNSSFKVSGGGFVDIKFEKFGEKYYLREARYTFGEDLPEEKTELLFEKDSFLQTTL